MTKSNSPKFVPSPEQKAIIESKGDTMVVSNPGTGKTTTLSLKVIDLLENGVKPEDILCLTFTAKAKKEMFDKIFEMSRGKFSDSVIMKIKIHTFHGFAFDYLTDAGLVSGDHIGNNLLRYSILQSFIDNKALTYGKSYIIQTMVGKVENAIRYIKNYGITPDKIDLNKTAKAIEVIHKPTKAYSKADMKAFLKYFVEAYKHYENSKTDAIDYSDMLLIFIEKFQGEKYQHVLVDEMQDMNDIQARIIEMISENLFLVGDAKQAIFGFQGGSIKNFQKFAQSCKPMLLSINRRSTQQILGYSKKYFLEQTEHRAKFEKELKNFNSSAKGSIPKIFSTDAPLKKILSLINENPDKDIGIITRKNNQIVEISKHLDINSVDYTTTVSQATTQEAKNEIIIFIKGRLSGDIKEKISATFTTFAPYTLQEAFEFSNALKRDGTLSKTKNTAKLDSWKIDLTKEDLNQLFSDEIYPLCVSKGSEWFSTAVSVKEQIDEYLTFETPTFEGLFDFIAIGEESYTGRSKKSVITLTTVHKAKGREFDVVIYVPSVSSSRTSFIDTITASIFQAKGIDLEDEIVEESLRVDFVAFTRAKEKLFVISDDKYAGTFHLENFSEFEVDEEEEETTSTALDTRLSEAYSLFVAGRYADSEKHRNSKETWLKEFIFSYFQNVDHFSYSSVTKDPFEFLMKNIVKRPFSSTALDFGGNVHNALEKIVIGKAKLKDYTDNEQMAIKNGLTVLEKLKKDNPGFTVQATELYQKIPIKSLTAYKEKDNFMFTGLIDAVFKHDDGIILVDYKTDKNNSGAYNHKKQLAVYKKMYSKLENVPEDKIETCLIFVALRGGISTGTMDLQYDIGVKPAHFEKFEKNLQTVLQWKKNPDEFIQELLEQSTKDTFHEVIKSKLENESK